MCPDFLAIKNMFPTYQAQERVLRVLQRQQNKLEDDEKNAFSSHLSMANKDVVGRWKKSVSLFMQE